MIVVRTPTGADTYIAVQNAIDGGNAFSQRDQDLLTSALRGTFSGTEVAAVPPVPGRWPVRVPDYRSIAVTGAIPSPKADTDLVEGIEKLLNGMVPRTDAESYTVIVLAQSLTPEDARRALSGYQEVATALSPLGSHQFQTGTNSSVTRGELESVTDTRGISDAVTKTHSINAGIFGGINHSVTGGISATPFGMGYSHSMSGGFFGGASLGYGFSRGATHGTTSQTGTTTGTQNSETEGSQITDTFTYTNYAITELIDKLEATIRRVNESQAMGLWNTSAYILAESTARSKSIAAFLRSIVQGEESFIEPSFVQTWSNKGETHDFAEIQKYLNVLCHPVFVSKDDADRVPVTPTLNVSTGELADVFAFPRHSVAGLPVIEAARFGRERHSLTPTGTEVDLGRGYHMLRVETPRVGLSRAELAKHTFVTGSTGTGKSNTVYELLRRTCLEAHKGVTFLVIEPAKGEYKDVFGGRDDVTVYGTNPRVAQKLLRLNPFAFPDEVHVLEHVDRLVEVFNAAWPMYAAMPAILRESIETAYEDVGWNLNTSRSPGRFPTFADLLDVLPRIVDTSAYSADTSSDYKGALVTRVRSLTRGIHGQVFAEDTSTERLFDANAIVDLSRVGSPETKALIMGVLVLRLQEHRVASGSSEGSLRHLTVLEEAHHLLRRTSTDQSQEGANLQGKAVEMLTDAIAEMRSYGEGFVIVDQSPGLLDVGVIRNTNTKLIHRLLDENDRVLVGRAAGLNDSQIIELARLEVGVAAVSQSGWIEPVLCKVDEFPLRERNAFTPPEVSAWPDPEGDAVAALIRIGLGVGEGEVLTDESVGIVRRWANSAGTRGSTNVPRRIVNAVIEGVSLTHDAQLRLAVLAAGPTLLDRVSTDPLGAAETAVLRLEARYGLARDGVVASRVRELFGSGFPWTDCSIRPTPAEVGEPHGC